LFNPTLAPFPVTGLGVLGVLGVANTPTSLLFTPILRGEGEPKLFLLNESRGPRTDFCHKVLGDADERDSLPSPPSDGLALCDKRDRVLLLPRLAGEPLRDVDERG
jgi:hypothetical protein